MKSNVILLIGAILLLMQSVFTFADNHEQPCTGVKLPLISTDQIIEAVICQTGGNVLKLESLDKPDNHFQVRILLPDGRIRNFLVEGRSGNLIQDEQFKKL